MDSVGTKKSSKRKQPGSSGNGSNSTGNNSNGFKALGLSDNVYRGIVKMGFRVRYLFFFKFLPFHTFLFIDKIFSQSSLLQILSIMSFF
jgi:hypothetical protein